MLVYLFTLSTFFKNKQADIPYTDAELVLAYQKSLNTTYVGHLFNRYGHLVYGVGLKYLQNQDDSKDLVLRVFEKILEDLKRMRVTHFKSWLYQVAKNQCLMDLRKKARNGASTAIDTLEHSLQAEESAPFQNQEIRFGQLEQAISQLKEEQRVAIQLFYIQEKSYQQISIQTGWTHNEVKSFIQNGKRNLRLLLEKDSVYQETNIGQAE
jgi:RNA polymerase sigma-70 factor (ECF subfamily)